MSDLVPKSGSIVVAPPADFWGEMAADDFAIPSVQIGQGTSSKGVIGEYNFNSGHHQKSLLGVSLIVPNKTRTLFAGKGQPTRCGSDNFHTPSPRYTNPISTNCGTCYAQAWGKEDDDKRALHALLNIKKDLNVPICQQTYSLMFLDGEGQPFFMDFRSSSLKIVQEKLLSRLRMGFSKAHPACVQFDMGVFRNDGKTGVFFEPTFDNFRVSDPDRMALGVSMYEQYSKRAQALRSEQIAKMDEAVASEREIKPAGDHNNVPWPSDDDGSIPF